MTRKIRSIQVLRAFAAIAVVHFHTEFSFGSWHTIGAFGVDIFFVISGFIMAMICTTGTVHFLRARLTRIVPLYWALTLVAFAFLVRHPRFDPELGRGSAELLQSLFFIPYVRSDGSIFPVLIIGWTLNYEICFYLILALSIAVCASIRFTHRAQKWVLPFAMLLLSALTLTMRLLPQNTITSFYGNPISLEFVAGIFVYGIFTRVSTSKCTQLRPLLYAIIPLSIAAMVWYEGTRFYLPHSTRAGLGVPAFLLLVSVVLLAKSGLDLNFPILVLLGDASYSLYLTHTFVISLFKHFIGSLLPQLNPWEPGGSIVAVVLSCAVAIAVHLALERPAHRSLNRLLNTYGAAKPQIPQLK